jgi:hypothetical protein
MAGNMAQLDEILSILPDMKPDGSFYSDEEMAEGGAFGKDLTVMQALRAENERLRGVLREIANEDYRGNRSPAAIKAHTALNS